MANQDKREERSEIQLPYAKTKRIKSATAQRPRAPRGQERYENVIISQENVKSGQDAKEGHILRVAKKQEC
jgi:hypothetical protein